MKRNRWIPDDGEPDRAELARRWYLRLASGEASVEEVRTLRAWLQSDADNERAFAEARALWQGLDPLSARPEIDRVRKPAVSRRVAGRVLAFGSACALALFLLPVGTWLADERTATGEVQALTLDDGTRVVLDTASALDVDYSESERRVKLVAGRAWFSVAHETGRPFVVQSGDADVRDVGTAFSVGRQAGPLAVDVAEGMVDVRTPNGVTRLTAGQRASFDGTEPKRAALSRNEIVWKNHRLIFEGRPLGEVLGEIDRYLPGKIILLDKDIANRPVTAILDLDHLETGIQALATTEHLDIRHITPWLTLIDKR